MEQPKIFEYYDKQELLEYLDSLRESGVCNMYGATPYIQEAFEMDKSDAREVLKYWMQTFGDPER